MSGDITIFDLFPGFVTWWMRAKFRKKLNQGEEKAVKRIHPKSPYCSPQIAIFENRRDFNQ
jgi:hypothetical protein